MPRLVSTFCALILFSPVLQANPDSRGLEFYESKIRPVLVEQCASCHSAKARKLRGGLSLDTRAEMIKGGDTGPALVPGKPDQSLLLRVVRHQGDIKMPPRGKLSSSIADDLGKWIAMDAPAPEGTSPAVVEGIDWTRAREFWAFRPVARPALPRVREEDRVHNPIDRFILARLNAEGLPPAPQAERAALLRRVTFDLTGLPPTPQELSTFLADTRPQAWERTVDRLLSSPAYGERWARYWLDVARYAEDQAHTFGVKPNTAAWRYRDWVIGALNTDMPYDRFVTLQVAADLVPDAAIGDRAALGFFGLGAQYYKNTDAARAIADELDDRVDTLSRGFLGLTVSCARCHDHKFDPIPTQDYYSLAGVFHSSKLVDLALAPREQVERFQAHQKQMQEADKQLKDFARQEKQRIAFQRAESLADHAVAAWAARAKLPKKSNSLDADLVKRVQQLLQPSNKMGQNVPVLEALRKPAPGKVTEIPAEVVTAAGKLQEQVLRVRGDDKKRNKPEDRALFQAFFGEKGALLPEDRDLDRLMPTEGKARMTGMRAKLETLRKEQPPAPPMAHGLGEGNPTDMKVYVRGNPATPGQVAPRRFPRILSGPEAIPFKQGSGRLELARAIASPNNPLTARVMVNRLWQHHFGRGLVNTPSNFGVLGERPTHPELLDYLADEFVRSGWSVKHMHRLLVTSDTYRRSTTVSEMARIKDPDNLLLGRMPRRRLDIEAWRDALLAVAGELDATVGGPTVDLSSDNNRRRTIYARISRHELNPLLRLFDFPDANITSEKRTETTVPQQQLFVLNSPFIVARSRALAARLADLPGDEARIDQAYRLLFSRSPSPEEVRVGTQYLAGKDDPAEQNKNQLSRWQRYAQALLASNEFLYLD